MKRITIYITLMAYVISYVVGCDSSPKAVESENSKTPISVDLASRSVNWQPSNIHLPVSEGNLKLFEYAVDTTALVARFNFEMTWSGGSQETLMVAIVASDSTQLPITRFTVEMKSRDNSTKWGYIFECSDAAPEILKLTEFTENSSLCIVMDGSDSTRRHETFIDGDDRILELDYSYALFNESPDPLSINASNQKTISNLREKFLAYYDWQSDLNNNKYGNLTNEILGSDLPQQFGFNGNADKKALRVLCSLLSAGATAKCILGGGPLNPVCWALAIGAVVCWALAFALELFGIES